MTPSGRSPAICARPPVVMYHSVGVRDATWLWPDLTCDWRLFDRHLACLAARGYRAVLLAEAQARRAAQAPPYPREVVISFDDGYLDNWVYAFPLLRRHGMRGLIYVTPEFVAPPGPLRPTLDDYWAGRCTLGDLPVRGFLNWSEIHALVRSGIIEIGSHSMTHTWHFAGPEVIDFHRPGAPYPWLAWNARPERKHAYREEDQTGFVPLGTPIHAPARALGMRRWLPDPALAAAAVARVAERGGPAFFSRADWRADLDDVLARVGPHRGRFESDAEMRARFAWEILESRRILERESGDAIRHFCWPGGAYDAPAWEVMAEAGYESVTVKRTDLSRVALNDPRHVLRISCHDHVTVLGRAYPARDAALLFHACEVERGARASRPGLQLRKLVAAGRARLERSGVGRVLARRERIPHA